MVQEAGAGLLNHEKKDVWGHLSQSEYKRAFMSTSARARGGST